MDEAEILHRVFGLVRLQVADEVPGHVAVQHIVFAHGLLDAVLTHIRRPGIDGLAHGRHIVVLRHGHELHGRILEHARAARLRRLDLSHDLMEIFCYHDAHISWN